MLFMGTAGLSKLYNPEFFVHNIPYYSQLIESKLVDWSILCGDSLIEPFVGHAIQTALKRLL
jgi:hypothetical protein